MGFSDYSMTEKEIESTVPKERKSIIGNECYVSDDILISTANMLFNKKMKTVEQVNKLIPINYNALICSLRDAGFVKK